MVYYRRRGRATKGRLRKRWYFNAGANLPIIGKTNVSFGSGSKFKRSVIQTVRRGLEEPLHKLWSRVGVSPPSSPILQNGIYTLGLTTNIPQGTSDNARTGDTIHLEALKFTLNLDQFNSTNPSLTKVFRIMIVKSDFDVLSGSDVLSAGGLGATDIFMANNQVVYEQTNPKASTVIYQKYVRLIPQLTTPNNASMVVSDIVKINQKFIYKTGTNYGKYSNYYFCIMGQESGGTTGTTLLGNCTFFGDLIFKDCK